METPESQQKLDEKRLIRNRGIICICCLIPATVLGVWFGNNLKSKAANAAQQKMIEGKHATTQKQTVNSSSAANEKVLVDGNKISVIGPPPTPEQLAIEEARREASEAVQKDSIAREIAGVKEARAREAELKQRLADAEEARIEREKEKQHELEVAQASAPRIYVSQRQRVNVKVETGKETS